MNTSLLKLAYWTKFLGWFMFITGIIECITIVGIVGGVIQIIMGKSLINGAEAAEILETRGTITDACLKDMISQYKTFFMVQGILTIIGLVSAGLVLLFAILSFIL